MQEDGQILFTLEGKNGKIELNGATVKIVFYEHNDSSRIKKVHEIPRAKITKAEYAKILGREHMIRVYFPGAGLMGFVDVYINGEQVTDAEKMIKMLTKAEAEVATHDEALQANQNLRGIGMGNDVIMTAEGVDTRIEVHEEIIKLFDKKGKATEVPIDEIKVSDLKKKGLTPGYLLLNFQGAGFTGKRVNFSEEHQEEFESLSKLLQEKVLLQKGRKSERECGPDIVLDKMSHEEIRALIYEDMKNLKAHEAGTAWMRMGTLLSGNSFQQMLGAGFKALIDQNKIIIKQNELLLKKLDELKNTANGKEQLSKCNSDLPKDH